jgi:hypothetical protein
VIDTHEPTQMAPTGRRRWVVPLAVAGVVVGVAVLGILAGFVLADRGDGSPPRPASDQLGDIREACNQWMTADLRGDSSSPTSCDDMTEWMNARMSNGSMTGSTMWADPDRMRSTCVTWMNAEPAPERPPGWCDDMPRGMWPHMPRDWDHRDLWGEWMDGPMMRGG